MSGDKNIYYPEQLTRTEDLDLARDKKAPLTKTQLKDADRELADRLKDPDLPQELKTALLDEAIALEAKFGNNSSGGHNSTGKKAGPSLEKTISETVSGKLNELSLAISALSPETLGDALKAGKQAVEKIEQGYAQIAAQSQTAQADTQMSSTPGANPDSPNQSNERSDQRDATDRQMATSAMAKSGQRSAKQQLDRERNELAVDIQAEITRVDPLGATVATITTAAHTRDLSPSQVKAAAENTLDTAANNLAQSPNGDRVVAEKLNKEKHAGAGTGTLVIGDISRASSNQLPSQNIGTKQQVASVSHMPFHRTS